MNVYLCGQKYFGQETLRLLVGTGVNVVGVSAPHGCTDGRADRLWTDAEHLGIPLLPAGLLNAGTLPAGVDLIVCAHAHDFIGRKTRLRARYGAIGYHPSLLPRHRGRDAIRWTIRMGDVVTGGTVYWLTDTVDGGPIAAQDWCWVYPGETPGDLWRRALQPLGLRLFARVLGDLGRGVMCRIPQDRALATWEPSIDQPALHRPDLELLGAAPDGLRVVVSGEGYAEAAGVRRPA